MERECAYCKKVKDAKLFYYRYTCKKCKTISDIKEFIINAKLSNHFNISIEEVKFILRIKDTGLNLLNHNSIGEHYRYNELMIEMNSGNYYNSKIIDNKTIDIYLDE